MFHISHVDCLQPAKDKQHEQNKTYGWVLLGSRFYIIAKFYFILGISTTIYYLPQLGARKNIAIVRNCGHGGNTYRHGAIAVVDECVGDGELAIRDKDLEAEAIDAQKPRRAPACSSQQLQREHLAGSHGSPNWPLEALNKQFIRR